MGFMDTYERWKREAVEDPDLIEELERIAGQEEEINDRFYRELDFGTAGLRGVIGAGDKGHTRSGGLFALPIYGCSGGDRLRFSY